MKRLLLVLLSIIIFNTSYSQNSQYAVEITHDKKVIHPENLHLPNSTTLLSLLKIIPELNSTSLDGILSEYAIEIEDVNVAESRDIILANLKIEDIKLIEIVKSPTKSFENNGQGGTINIELKDVKKTAEGYVSANVNSGKDFTPMIYFGSKTKKLEIKAIVAYESYNPYDNKIEYEGETENKIVTNQSVFNAQMARVYLTYKPNENNTLKFCISDNYKKNTDKSFSNIKKSDSTWVNEQIYTLRANTKYEHLFKDKSKLTLEVNYNYIPDQKEQLEPLGIFTGYSKSHNIGGKAEYKAILSKSVSLFGGTNYNLCFSNELNYQTYRYFPISSERTGGTYYVSPYLRVDCNFGKFFLKAIADYQFYNYNIKAKEQDKINITRNDLTGKLALGWQFTPHNYIKLMFDRKLNRPLNEQVYPFFTYSMSKENYVKGNSYLRPVTSNQIELEYISDHKTANDHFMTFGAAIDYISTKDIITESKIQALPFSYLTFANDDDNDIYAGNLMYFFKANIFSVSFTGNLYFVENKVHHFSNFYKLSIYPTLFFPNGWMAACNYEYVSSINTGTSFTYPQQIIKCLIEKNFRRWVINAYGYFYLNNKTTKQPDLDSPYRIYNYYSSPISIGLSARFRF